MKQTPKMAGGIVAAISAIGALQIACVSILLYSMSRCSLLLLAGLILLLPALTQLILLLPRLAAAKKLPALEETADRKAKLLHWIGLLGYKLKNGYKKIRTVLILVLLGIAALGCHSVFWTVRPQTQEVLGYHLPVIFGVLFALSIVLEKWCAHATDEQDTYYAAILKGLRSAFFLFRWVCAAIVVTLMLKLLGLYDAKAIAQTVLTVLFVYETAIFAFCAIVRVIRKEMDTKPEFLVSLQGMGNDKNILDYLEENTGITMRSLWSMHLVKKVLPLAIFSILVLLWLSTGIVQIQPHQEGVLFRLGKMQEETLQPGIHLTLPKPFDQVELHNTKAIRKVAIGYVPEGEQDNLWTEAHGGEEYRLLLGGGEEIVSINLIVQYRIKDLKTYVKSLSSPEALLQAQAYEIVTQRTIATDLDSLLSIDREAFAESFRRELEEKLDDRKTGLEVVNVVLESIHPPVEIADVYQDIISAELQGEKIIITAQSDAEVAIKLAEIEKLQNVGTARIRYENQVGEATAAVADFMASVEADKSNRDSYRYYKYISALTESYNNAKLVIVGDGVDSKHLYIGSITEPEQ